MSQQNPRLAKLHAAGVSIWLDDLSRDLIQSHALADKITTQSVSGVTTNPSIFQAAISDGKAYRHQIGELASQGHDVDTIIRVLTTDDVRDACDVFAQVYKDSHGVDGRVSIEVDPRLAHDTAHTVLQAQQLWEIVDRPNLMIKIPATIEGIPAITQVIAQGISVNVTLIFSVQRYEQVIQAYLAGLTQAKEAGKDLTTIHSVASFFISRVDTEIDKRLEAINTPPALTLRGKAGLANARLAYDLFQKYFEAEPFAHLRSENAQIQRPLWASTGVKNPNYPDTLYISELVAPHTVNTIPEKTLAAFADHGEINPNSIIGQGEESARIFKELTTQGIDLDEVFIHLENEGVEKFISAWSDLLQATQKQTEG